jgi:zinc transport system permease protein
MIVEALSLPFMQRVLLAGLLASVAAGIVGTFVVVKRMSSITGGLAHAAFGGIGLGYFLGINPMLGAAGFGIASGIGVGLAHQRFGSSLDTAISIFWSAGMALGVIFIALAPGYAPDLSTYLFGSILFASWEYVGLVAALDVLIVATSVWLYSSFRAVAFDEEFSAVVGIPVQRLTLLLLSLIALSVVTLIQVVGIILAIALLTIPAETARPWARSLAGMMVLAGVLSAIATTAGILGAYVLSARWDLSIPSGPFVIVLSVAMYGVSQGLRWLTLRRQRAEA